MPGFRCDIPAQPTLQLDDVRARVTRWDFEPGAATGWHRHEWPYLIVMLVDATLRVHDGTEEKDTQFSSGQCYMRLAGVEHDVMNTSSTPIAFIEIELKTLRI
jgi:quercetin dioxygenase-like cupin family protein